MTRLTDRRVVRLFVGLSALPFFLTVNSFKPFVPLVPWFYPLFGDVFRVMVYVPVTTVRTVLFEPLGLTFLYSISAVQHVVIVFSLLLFYYVLAVVFAHLAGYVHDKLVHAGGRASG